MPQSEVDAWQAEFAAAESRSQATFTLLGRLPIAALQRELYDAKIADELGLLRRLTVAH